MIPTPQIWQTCKSACSNELFTFIYSHYDQANDVFMMLAISDRNGPCKLMEPRLNADGTVSWEECEQIFY